MNSQPKITVVIPNFNHESFIEERIRSILTQSYEQLELYILDDCSTDDSLSIIENYRKDPKVKGILSNSKNSGSLFKQWAKAISLASGDYLWIAESDDLAHKDFLKVTVEALKEYPNSGLVFTDTVVIDHKGNHQYKASETNKYLKMMTTAKITNIPANNCLFEYFISNIIIWNASAVLFKTELIKKINTKMLSTLNNAGDLYTYLTIALKNDILFIAEPLNYFRQHDQNTTQKNIKSGALFKDRIRIVSYFFPELLKIDKSKWHLQVFLSRHFITAIDHGLYSDVKSLVKLYQNNHLIHASTSKRLLKYCWWIKHMKFATHRYRSRIKRELLNIIEPL